jgi:DMSO/TMAO reductase YedYZ molybdopterin-dependent catalytic subunit
MTKRISRREFLLIGAIGTASLLVPDLAGCNPAQPEASNPTSPTQPGSATATPANPGSITPTSCGLSPAVVPTRPAKVPGYAQLDPDTGLHMTGRPVDIDIDSYRLKVYGKVNNVLALSYDELRCMPKITTKSTSICTGFFEDRATWAGVPFAHILDLADARPEATYVTLKGADGYSCGTQIEAARLDGAYLAYEWEGQPIPVLHGFPLRAIYVSNTGSLRVKWLLEIEIA